LARVELAEAEDSSVRLWMVNELYKEPLTQADLQVLGTLLM
jgi:hypothetical protein